MPRPPPGHRTGAGARLHAMGETMKAYRIIEWEHAPELTEAPVPEPGPGQVLVEVAGNGLCHSDIGMTQMPGDHRRGGRLEGAVHPRPRGRWTGGRTG